MPWSKEEDFLNHIYSAATKSTQLASGLTFSGKQSKYHIRIESLKLHRTVWIDFNGTKTCEIGDILFISKYIEPRYIVSRNVCFVQVKAANRSNPPNKWVIDEKQLEFYLKWPTIQRCHVAGTTIAQNSYIKHRDRLFSPYLLLGRDWNTGGLSNPHPWITGADLIAAACRSSKTICGPIELPFLSHLVRLLFQTTGERDILYNKSKNLNLTQLVNNLLQYVGFNDPPEDEGRPFVAVIITVKKAIE